MGTGARAAPRGIESATGVCGSNRIAFGIYQWHTREREGGDCARLKASRGRESGMIGWCGVVWLVCRVSKRARTGGRRRGEMGEEEFGAGGDTHTHMYWLAGLTVWQDASRAGNKASAVP
jgi:hypothetical protein